MWHHAWVPWLLYYLIQKHISRQSAPLCFPFINICGLLTAFQVSGDMVTFFHFFHLVLQGSHLLITNLLFSLVGCVNSHLIWHLELHSLLLPFQYGLCKNWSPLDPNEFSIIYPSSILGLQGSYSGVFLFEEGAWHGSSFLWKKVVLIGLSMFTIKILCLTSACSMRVSHKDVCSVWSSACCMSMILSPPHKFVFAHLYMLTNLQYIGMVQILTILPCTL